MSRLKNEASKRWYEKNADNRIKQVKKRLNSIKEWYHALKMTKKCKICKVKPTEKQLVKFHFHHKNPETKTDSIANMVRSGFSIPKIKEEMKKCEFLCKECHASVTWS